MKKLEKRIEKWSWWIVIFAASYLAFTTGREAVHVWELWLLTAAFVFIAVSGFVKLIKKEETK